MKRITTIVMLLCFMSCVPVRIAPKIESHKIMVAKKFKRQLPRETSFIFEDPKDAYEFYDYINTKFQLKDLDVGLNTPFQIEGETFYLSYQEAEISDKTLNVPLVLIDAKRDGSGNSRLFEGQYVSRKGNWYLVLNVYDEALKNCLLEDHPYKDKVINYLENMRTEYVSTSNYLDVLFSAK